MTACKPTSYLMRPFRASPAALLAAAFVSIAALMALSDFDPEEISGLGDLDDDAATLSVVIVECRACTGGYLIEISDGLGGEATAFCPSRLLEEPLPSGEVVTMTVQRSPDDPAFLFVQDIAESTGKD